MNDVPEMYQGIFAKARSGQSRSAAIKAFCLQCVGFVRKDITRCTAKQCPLYVYRPYQAEDE